MKTCGECKRWVGYSANSTYGVCGAPLPMWIIRNGEIDIFNDLLRAGNADNCKCFEQREPEPKAEVK